MEDDLMDMHLASLTRLLERVEQRFADDPIGRDAVRDAVMRWRTTGRSPDEVIQMRPSPEREEILAHAHALLAVLEKTPEGPDRDTLGRLIDSRLFVRGLSE